MTNRQAMTIQLLSSDKAKTLRNKFVKNFLRELKRSLGLSLLVVCAGLVQAQAAQTATEMYSQGLQQIEERRYKPALATFRKLQKNHPDFRQMAAVQTRVAVLHESVDADESLVTFLKALSLRDSNKIEEALAELAVIAQAYPAGSLTDDALYISAYLKVMDRYDFAAARVDLRALRQRFPESAYSDSAQYLDAIAMEQMGDTQGARQSLLELRERHTALSLPLEFRWPVGSALSRYWFDRADRRLAIVEQRLAEANILTARKRDNDGKLRVAVSVDGADMQLLLVPSPLTKRTQWLDASLRSTLPPSIGVFDGTVEGIDGSWVRAVLKDNAVTGVVYINGEQKKLQPANLIGTLDYYQPRSKKPVSEGGRHSGLADHVQGLDALIAPPQRTSDLLNRSRTALSDMRSVPLSIVVDSQYDRYYAGGGMANALNNLNVADGVFRQFGLSLMLDEALSFDSSSDPLALGAVTLETILRSFRDYRLQYKTLFEDSALSYLFTGNPKTDVTLGLAWIETACRVDGYDVGVTTPSTFGDVLLTHELGHSLGAQHDSDTQCNDNSLSLMWPNISERTSTQFTHCSRQSILGTRTKNCLKNIVDLNLVAHSTGNTVNFQLSNPDSALTLDARLTVETSAPDQLEWPAGCTVQTPTSALCFIDAIAPQERRTLIFGVRPDFQDNDAPVTAQVEPVGLLEMQYSDNLATTSLSGSPSIQPVSVNTPVGEQDISVMEPQNSLPTAGAAKSIGSVGLSGLIALLTALVSARHCRHNCRASTQFDFVLVLHKFCALARFSKQLLVRVA